VFAYMISTTTTAQKCEAVPRRARIDGSQTFVSLNSRLDSNEDEEDQHPTNVLEEEFKFKNVKAGKFTTRMLSYSHERSCCVVDFN